jgi:hypothetical protein
VGKMLGVLTLKQAVNVIVTVLLRIKKDDIVRPCNTYSGNMK